MRDGVCVVDIGSGSVGAALVAPEAGKNTVKIWKTVRLPITSGTEESRAAIETLATQTVAKAFEALKGAKAPSEVHVFLAAPWYHAKITTINSKSEKPVKVSEGTVSRAVKEYFSRKGEQGPQGELIESIVTQVYVNGYPTALDTTVIGSTLRVNHFASEADHGMKKSVLEAVQKAFPHAKTVFHSFSLAAFATLRALRPENNFVVVDAGAEITDIIVTHRDGFRFIGTFPVGTHSLVRKIAEGASLADAHSRLSLFMKGELSTEEQTAFSAKFEAAAEEWSKGFASILETAVKEVAVPQTTFVFADHEELKWMSELITRERGVFSSRAVPVTPDFFHSEVMLGEDAVFDSFLSMEAIFVKLDKRDLIEIG